MMKDNNLKQQQKGNSKQKRAYQVPKLVRFGDAVEITMGGGYLVSDAGAWMGRVGCSGCGGGSCT